MEDRDISPNVDRRRLKSLGNQYLRGIEEVIEVRKT